MTSDFNNRDLQIPITTNLHNITSGYIIVFNNFE